MQLFTYRGPGTIDEYYESEDRYLFAILLSVQVVWLEIIQNKTCNKFVRLLIDLILAKKYPIAIFRPQNLFDFE